MSWTWWMTLLVIALALFLIGCIPVGIDAEQNEAGLRLDAKIWMFRIQILPKKPKKPKKKKEKEKSEMPAAAEPAQSAEPQKKKPKFSLKGNGDGLRLGLDSLLKLLGYLRDLLGGVRRKLRVKELTIHVCFDGRDPAKAAIQYGRAWAAIGVLTPALEQVFVIKKRDISPILDYNNRGMELDGHLFLTISVGRLLVLALRFVRRTLVLALRTWLGYKTIQKNKTKQMMQ